jgi:ssRNA-specific RNase YbeY (16S rRNA maturation enzyme)
LLIVFMWLKRLIVSVIFIILAGLFLSYFYSYLPGETKEFLLSGTLNGLPEVSSEVSSNLVQFAPNMRFNHNDLTYSFISECEGEKINKMEEAFREIKTKTGIISFQRIDSEEADILISCSKKRIEEVPNTFITGEGGPSKFLNLSLYPLIIQGEIVLYDGLYNVFCEKPIVEVHELLHVFGYDHIDNKSSVLYPYFSCDQELDKLIIDDLVRIYSEEPKAELIYQEVEATKSGNYLNFNVSVSNEGIIVNKIDFVLKTLAEEYNSQNNKATLTLDN